MSRFPPVEVQLFLPDTGPTEAAAAARVVASGWLGRGPETDGFEVEFAAHLGVSRDQLIALPSCTDGLFLAMEALELKPGDEVVLPTVSFVGAGQAILAAGARPGLCDVDPRSLNPAAEHIAAKLTPRTRAVVLLHYGGVPCDMGPIMALLDARGITLVEDSACSPASSIGGKMCGTFGAFATWSFDAMKLMSAGEGGMLYVRDPKLAARIRLRTVLGMSSASGLASASEHRWWEFDVAVRGRRTLYCDVLAAVARVQLARLDEMVTRRGQIARHYRQCVGGHGKLALPPAPPPGAVVSDYFFWVQLESALRDELARVLRFAGIYTSFRYYPLHRMTLFRDPGPFPGADEAANTTLNLPLHSKLTAQQVDRVCEVVDGFLRDSSDVRAVRASASPRAA